MDCRAAGWGPKCLVERFSCLPPDTKTYQKKRKSQCILLAEITNFKRNSLKKSWFPEDSEGAKSLHNYEEQFSGIYFRDKFSGAKKTGNARVQTNIRANTSE